MKNLWLLFVVGLATGFIGEKKLLVSSQSPSSTTDDMYLEGQTSGNLPIDDEDGEDDGSGSGSGDYAFTDISDKDELLRRFLNFSKTTVSKEMVPVQPQPSAESSHIPPTTAAAADNPVQRVTGKTSPDVEKVPSVDPADGFTQHTSLSSTDLPPSKSTTSTFGKDINVTNHDNSWNWWDISRSRDEEENILINEEADNEISASDRRITDDLPDEVTSENLWERTEVLAAVIACGVVGFLCAVFLLLLLAYRMKKKDEGSYDLGDTKLSTTAYHKAPTKEFYA